MSDTPRTDAVKLNNWEEDLPQVVVPAEKMAELERESSEAKAARDSLRAINAELEEAGNILLSALHSESIQGKIAARQKWDKALTKSEQAKV